jgi:diguanylate cyclase (GGDEF)-like protein
MSLMRQLWLAVFFSALVAFVGSLFISVWTAQSYLSQQLERKNIDIANSLALSITQLDKEQVMIDLQVAAIFDTGHYLSISVSDSLGRVISVRKQDKLEIDVPSWFLKLFPIHSTPGIAEISTSRDKYGAVQVISHNQFAYQALWRQARNLLFWFGLVGVAVGLLAMLVLRSIGRSLDMVVTQAEAIGERRLMTISEPKITELKALARAMNGMVERVWKLFNEEAGRIDDLRRRVNHDQLTGLPNRDYFMSHFKSELTATETSQCGVLVLIRLSDLNNFNTVLGRQATDDLLCEIGSICSNFSAQYEDSLAGRIKSGEFAIVVPGECDAPSMCQKMSQVLGEKMPGKWGSLSDIYHLGVVSYERAGNLVDILSKADHAVTMAEGIGLNASHALVRNDVLNIMPGEQWHTLLSNALEAGDMKLAFYPVRRKNGSILHQEAMVRLRTDIGKPLIVAGEFMPIVSHFNLSAQVDLDVVRKAIQHLTVCEYDVAVNISAASIANWTFRNELSKLLRSEANIRSRLWLEVSEYGAFKHFDAFKDICFSLKALGCHIGVEQFGQRMSEIKKITELGLDYVKLHASLVDGIDTNVDNQEFIRRFCEVVHTVGVDVIAVGVQSDTEWEMLKSLGVNAATGPAIVN